MVILRASSIALIDLLSHEYTSDYNKILNSEKVIFPGVGDAAYAMNKLKSKGLDKVIIDIKQPLLGICLGMQLLCNSTEEETLIALELLIWMY